MSWDLTIAFIEAYFELMALIGVIIGARAVVAELNPPPPVHDIEIPPLTLRPECGPMHDRAFWAPLVPS